MATLHEMVNAWIFLSKGEPSDTVHTDPSRRDQDPVHQGIHGAVDILTLSLDSAPHGDPTAVPSDAAAPTDGSTMVIGVAEVDAGLLGAGTKAEPDDCLARHAYADTKTYFGYRAFTCWRLNSDRYEFERTQQKALYALVLSG